MASVGFVPSAEGEEWILERLDHPDLPAWVATSPEGRVAGITVRETSVLEALARRRGARLTRSDGGRPSAALRQLEEYLAGTRRDFELEILADPAASAFEQAAWEALCAIPFGEVRSYGQQARMLGKPGAARAVGRANGRNPVAVVVPCHRIIGSDGSLTGFTGGLSRKRWLLAHEGVRLRPDAGPSAPVPDNQLSLGL